MSRLSALCAGFGILVALLLAAAPASANGTSGVTYVLSTGSDNNTAQLCARTAPCQTFGAALSVTTGGGAVNCLDPLLLVGPVVINTDVTIDCGQTQAAIFAPANNSAVTVNSAVKVTLRGLQIYSDEAFNGNFGILVAQGAMVRVEKCHIFGFTGNPGSGISVQVGGQLTIEDSTIEGNFAGGIDLLPTSGDLQVKIHNSSIIGNLRGILAKPTGGATVEVAIEHSHIDNNNGGGVRADGTGGGAVSVAITDSSMSENASNGVVAVSGPSGNVRVSLIRALIARNKLFGVQSNQASGGTATIVVGGSLLSDNVSGALNFVSGGALLTYGNNQIFGPGGTGFSGPVGLQ